MDPTQVHIGDILEHGQSLALRPSLGYSGEALHT